jgi:tetratricopeptide (TPR) repeat protein
MSRRARRSLLAGLLALLAASSGAAPATADEAAAGTLLLPVPRPHLGGLDPLVAEQLGEVTATLEGAQALLGGRLEAPVAPAGRVERGRLAGLYGEAGFHYHAYRLLDSAEAAYRNAEALVDDAPRWPHLLGLLHAAAGRPDEAAAAFERALVLSPDDTILLAHLGEAQRSAGRLAAARAAFAAVLRLREGSPAGHAGLGQVALAEGRHREAVEHLEAALAAVPGATLLHHPLGMAYRGLGDLEAAGRHLALRGEVGLRPPDPLVDELAELGTGERVFTLRGRQAFRMGRYGEAVELFRKAVGARPEAAGPRVNLAAALALAGEREGAVAELRHALELGPDNPTALYNLGSLLRAGGDAAGAVVHLRQAAALAPRDAAVRLELAEALAALGDHAGAAAHFRAALDAGTVDDRARLGEADALVQAGRPDAALARLEEAHAGDPANGTVAHALARLLAAGPELVRRNGERALELAQRVYAAAPRARHAETVALALAESGRCEEAAAWQVEALAGDGDAGTVSPELLELFRDQRPCRYPGG